MRILFISGAAPAKAADGSSASFTTLQSLAGEGHRIDYAWFRGANANHDPAVIEQWKTQTDGRLQILELKQQPALDGIYARVSLGLRQPCVAMNYAMAKLTGNKGRMDALFREAFQSLPFRSRLINDVRRKVAANGYDLVVVEYPWLVRLGRFLPDSVPRVFTAHEIQTQIVEQLTNDARLVQRVRDREASEMRVYDGVITLCPEDEEFVRTMGVANVYCSPLAIAAAASPLPPAPLRTPLTLTFLGGYQHPPNRDGLEWLSREIVPAIAGLDSPFTVEIIGRYPPEVVERYSNERFRFTGFVDELGPRLSGRIFLCPIRIGSGMRIKILDAIACGAPVISTELGARGLGLVNDQSYLVADTPVSFAEQVKRLATDPTLVQQIVEASQAHIAARFAPRSVARRHTEVFDRVIADFQAKR